MKGSGAFRGHYRALKILNDDNGGENGDDKIAVLIWERVEKKRPLEEVVFE